MAFTSLACLLFVGVTASVYHFIPLRLRPGFLLAVSCVFYCTWDSLFALETCGVTAFCYFAARQIERSRRSQAGSRLLTVSVCALVVHLAFFKLRSALASGGGIAVPLGISYVTFRLIGYMVDVAWGKIGAEPSWIRFFSYVLFFPQLVAGPIHNARDFLPQIQPMSFAPRPWITQGLIRILLGCLKKLAAADQLSVLVAYGFHHAGDGSAVPSALAFYLFPLQLYLDFSGLTDIAVGIALLFGIKSPENFDAPFAASTIGEFWRRWHMSLTGWLKDYVFMPVRMATRNWGSAGLAFSVIVNMMLVAFWHAFTVAFLIFGILHSIYLVCDVLTASARKRYYKRHAGAAKLTALAGPVFVYHMVAVSLVFMRATSLTQGMQVLTGLTAGLGHAVEALAEALAPPRHYVWSAVPFTILAVIAEHLRRRGVFEDLSAAPRWLRWSVSACTTVWVLFLILVFLGQRGEVNPFVYAKF